MNAQESTATPPRACGKSVYWWDGDSSARSLGSLESFGKKVKPEALLPLDRTDHKLRVLLLFDGPEEGAPRPVKIDPP